MLNYVLKFPKTIKSNFVQYLSEFLSISPKDGLFTLFYEDKTFNYVFNKNFPFIFFI